MTTVLADLRPLRQFPVFRRLWFGTTVSAFGSRMAAFAVTYFVWDRTHNPAAVGLIGLVSAAPLIAFALLGSAFTDHVNRRRLVLVMTVGQLVVSLAMAAVAASTASTGSGALPGSGASPALGASPGPAVSGGSTAAFAGGPVWAMLALAGLSSGLSAIGEPARRTFVPLLLPAERLPAGLALNQLAFQLSILVGPAAAGLVIAHWGTATCFVVNAASFGAALVGLAGLPAVAAPAAADQGRAGASAVWAGIRFVARTPAVRGAFLADLCATVLAMPVAVFPALNQEKFGGSPAVLGLLTSAIAVGGVLASALSGLVTGRRRPGLVLLGCGAVWGGALAGVGLAGPLPLVLVLLAVAGGADTWAVVARTTVTQTVTPASHRGRVNALEHIVGAAGPQLGSLRAGLVAAQTSGRATLVIGGLSGLLGTAAVTVLVPSLRHFHVGDPAPVTPVGDPAAT